MRIKILTGGATAALVALLALQISAWPAQAVNPNLKTTYGAVGDGITDDTAAVQAALDNGARVDVPAGTYRITDDLEFVESSHLRGTSGAILSIEGDHEIFGDGTRNVSLFDLTIERSTSANTAVKSVIRLFRADGATFDNLVINNAKTTAPVILVAGRWENTSNANTCYNIRVTNNTIQDYQRIEAGGLGPGSGEGVKGTGILVAHCRTFDISNNSIDDNQRFFSPSSNNINFQGAGIAMSSSIYGVVSGNVIDYAGQGIDVGGGYNIPSRSSADLAQNVSNGLRGAQFVSIHNNVIRDTYIAGIKIVNGASNNEITNNEVTRSGLAGIWLIPGNSASKDGTVVRNNIISANTVTDSGAGPGEDGWSQTLAGSAIVIEFATPDSSYPGADARVRSNIITQNSVVSSTGDMPHGINDQGVTSDNNPQYSIDNFIVSNQVSGATIASLLVSSTRNTPFNN